MSAGRMLRSITEFCPLSIDESIILAGNDIPDSVSLNDKFNSFTLSFVDITFSWVVLYSHSIPVLVALFAAYQSSHKSHPSSHIFSILDLDSDVPVASSTFPENLFIRNSGVTIPAHVFSDPSIDFTGAQRRIGSPCIAVHRIQAV